MAGCYNVCVRYRYPSLQPNRRSTLPHVWLISDARIDDRLEAAIESLPSGSGLVFRHYHLAPAARRARFDQLAKPLRRRGHVIILSGTAHESRAWGADGSYGPPARLSHGAKTLRLVTVHSLKELGRANRMRANAVLLSPMFPTRSHPGAPALGPVRWRLLAARSRHPVIALGGMNAKRARLHGIKRWAAIESLA